MKILKHEHCVEGGEGFSCQIQGEVVKQDNVQFFLVDSISVGNIAIFALFAILNLLLGAPMKRWDRILASCC